MHEHFFILIFQPDWRDSFKLNDKKSSEKDDCRELVQKFFEILSCGNGMK